MQCEDCGHIQVAKGVRAGGVNYFGSAYDWCDMCESGLPVAIEGVKNREWLSKKVIGVLDIIWDDLRWLKMNQEKIKEIEGLLLARFLSLQGIADYAKVTLADVDKVMMEMELPDNWNDDV